MFPSRPRRLPRRAGAPLAALAALLFLAPATPANDADSGHCYLERWVPNDLVPDSNAGRAVAFDGDTAVVGAPGREAVYVYERTGGTWQQVDVLESPASPNAKFGHAVGLFGSYLVVGAPYDSTNDLNAGGAFLYERQPGGWVLEETFQGVPNGFLGYSVDVDGTEELRVAVGCNGGLGFVEVFEQIGANWSSRGYLVVQDSVSLGTNLDLDGDTLVVADRYAEFNGSSSGAVHHWSITPAPSVIDYVGVLVPSDGFGGQSFGYSLAIDGQDRLVVGAPYDNDAGPNAGAVYVYESQPTGVFPFYEFGGEEKIVPCDIGANAGFGSAVDVDGNRIAIGAYTQSLWAASGALHVYGASPLGAGWVLQDVVTPDDGVPLDYFASEVALAGDHVLASAPFVDPGIVDGGATYLVSLTRKAPGGGQCPCDTLAMATSYGTGKAGSLGVPVLSMDHPPVPGEPSLFKLTGVPLGVQPFVFWGNVPAAIPFDGGTLLMADPNGEWMPVATVLNQVGIQWQVPNMPALCGSEVVFQGMFIDPAGWGQFKTAQSNGLHTIVGY